MKKKLLALTLSLAMVLGFSACESKRVEDNFFADAKREALAETKTSDSSTPDLSNTDELSDEHMTLTEWYNTIDRRILENTVNSAYEEEELVLTYFITVEEPDTLIYNYQFTDKANAFWKNQAQADIDAYFRLRTSELAPNLVDDISAFQANYNMPLTTIRLTYLDTDGSLIYSEDISEDWKSPAALESSGTNFANLQAWMESPDAALTLQAINQEFISSGMTVKFSAEGNVFVYQYYVSDSLGADSLPQDRLSVTFTALVEQQISTFDTLFDAFESNYGILLDGVRCDFYKEDGVKLFSSEVFDRNGKGTASSLQLWMETEEAADTVRSINQTLASYGMTVEFLADGNVFVFKYYVSDSRGMNSLSQEQMAAAFSPIIEQQMASINSTFDAFETSYGILLDGVQFIFCSENGAVLFTSEVIDRQ